MSRKLLNAQLTAYATNTMYVSLFKELAENVFKLDNLPKMISTYILNTNLVENGSVAWFYDEILDSVLCLPYTDLNPSAKDLRGNPTFIEAKGPNGYRNKLKEGEFVIMYDNNGRFPLLDVINSFAGRYAEATCIRDTNIRQQKIGRIWKTSSDKLASIKSIVNNIEANVESIFTYEDIDEDDLEVIVEEVPYKGKELNESREAIKNEFLSIIGISNFEETKKERVIKDEVSSRQGGTIAFRFTRFTPRKEAIDLVNEKFKDHLEKPIVLGYYDNLPTSLDSMEEDKENNKVDEEVDDDEFI